MTTGPGSNIDWSSHPVYKAEKDGLGPAAVLIVLSRGGTFERQKSATREVGTFWHIIMNGMMYKSGWGTIERAAIDYCRQHDIDITPTTITSTVDAQPFNERSTLEEMLPILHLLGHTTAQYGNLGLWYVDGGRSGRISDKYMLEKREGILGRRNEITLVRDILRLYGLYRGTSR